MSLLYFKFKICLKKIHIKKYNNIIIKYCSFIKLTQIKSNIKNNN